MGKGYKEKEFLAGHLYRVEPFPFFDGGKRKPKFMIPLNDSGNGRLSYILLTKNNSRRKPTVLIVGKMAK